MKKPRFNLQDWEMINAYGHGWGYGVNGLEVEYLWSEGEEGRVYENRGWNDGLTHFEMCGAPDGNAYDFETEAAQ